MIKQTAVARGMGLLLALLVWGGCVSHSPPIRHFLLTPMASDVLPTRPAHREQRQIVVEPVELPPYLNRTQIVTRSSANHLNLSPFEHWGDTLKANISRVLLENLSTLLGTDRVASPTTLTHDRPTLRILSQVSQF
ncbi:MAG: membrane integrity-associated transporter subunit PqiC, partial [Magnetococcales bacterium]|nr:membrane integrity-associated transporter subunit PqiC [Magnetococcales bacterium]